MFSPLFITGKNAVDVYKYIRHSSLFCFVRHYLLTIVPIFFEMVVMAKLLITHQIVEIRESQNFDSPNVNKFLA
jgi:hypothetical protein